MRVAPANPRVDAGGARRHSRSLLRPAVAPKTRIRSTVVPPTSGNEPAQPRPPARLRLRPQTPAEQVKQILDARKTDYSEALRTASLKLRDNLPTLAEIKTIDGAPDDAAQEGRLREARRHDDREPRVREVDDQVLEGHLPHRSGRHRSDGHPNSDTAATSPQRSSSRDVPTATCSPPRANTCPTFDPATSTSRRPRAPGGVKWRARRPVSSPTRASSRSTSRTWRSAATRFIQETFACSSSRRSTAPRRSRSVTARSRARSRTRASPAS